MKPLDRFFEITARGSTLGTEVRGGVERRDRLDAQQMQREARHEEAQERRQAYGARREAADQRADQDGGGVVHAHILPVGRALPHGSRSSRVPTSR